jgi:hypothetical protein
MKTIKEIINYKMGRRSKRKFRGYPPINYKGQQNASVDDNEWEDTDSEVLVDTATNALEIQECRTFRN